MALRLDGSTPGNLVRLFFLALAIVVLGAVSFASVIALRTWSFANRQLHPPRLALPDPPAVEGLKTVEFLQSDGTILRAWWVPSKNDAAVILCHGYGSNRSQLSVELGLLARHGYGALALDLPAHGLSGGDVVTWGDREQASVVAAIGFVSAQADVDPQRIGALGFSMGGSAVVEVAAVDHRLKAIAISGTYTTLRDELNHEAAKWGLLSQIPLRKAMERAGVGLDRVRPIDIICKVSPRPVLIIEGGEDVDSPVEMEQALVDAACDPKTYWLVPGAHHGDYTSIDLPGYERQLFALFDGALLN